MIKAPLDSISIIIPTLNEAGNIENLVRRIDQALARENIVYQLIFIDDRSSDQTVDEVMALARDYPVECHLKQGKRGKAFSIQEGLPFAKYHLAAYIDADLQYPPEAIPKMIAMIRHGHDIVVAGRQRRHEPIARRFMSRCFNLFFSTWLHGLDVDTQAGLKVFKTRIAREVELSPSPWTFDLEFLIQARNFGYVIGEHEIVFAERQIGKSKIKFKQAVLEIGWNAVKLRFKPRPPLLIHPENLETMVGAGIAHRKKRFITHTTLHRDFSALRTFSPGQAVFLFSLLFVLILALAVRPLISAIVILGIINFLYFFDTLFNLFLVARSMKQEVMIKSSPGELAGLDDSRLPVYSILCPLYREKEVLPLFVRNIARLEWPKDKLDVLLLLEENDPETIAAARAMDLPPGFRIIVVPHSMPKTKPKACNFGLGFVRGEYTVIFDAEDNPDPWQLKKAYLGFRKSSPRVRCLQAKLNYFNAQENLLTRFFAAEYSLWFDVILPGLQSISTSIPLGGDQQPFPDQGSFGAGGLGSF